LKQKETAEKHAIVYPRLHDQTYTGSRLRSENRKATCKAEFDITKMN